MIKQHLRKSGNSYVVTIPKEEVERLQLREGELITVEVSATETHPVLPPDLKEIFERRREAMRAAMEYLAEH
jgi:antitoxin component of MazEF toxin-antitoxin module